MVLETHMKLSVKEPDFFRKISFAPDTGEMVKKWHKNKAFRVFNRVFKSGL